MRLQRPVRTSPGGPSKQIWMESRVRKCISAKKPDPAAFSFSVFPVLFAVFPFKRNETVGSTERVIGQYVRLFGIVTVPSYPFLSAKPKRTNAISHFTHLTTRQKQKPPAPQAGTSKALPRSACRRMRRWLRQNLLVAGAKKKNRVLTAPQLNGGGAGFWVPVLLRSSRPFSFSSQALGRGQRHFQF